MVTLRVGETLVDLVYTGSREPDAVYVGGDQVTIGEEPPLGETLRLQPFVQIGGPAGQAIGLASAANLSNVYSGTRQIQGPGCFRIGCLVYSDTTLDPAEPTVSSFGDRGSPAEIIAGPVSQTFVRGSVFMFPWDERESYRNSTGLVGLNRWALAPVSNTNSLLLDVTFNLYSVKEDLVAEDLVIASNSGSGTSITLPSVEVPDTNYRIIHFVAYAGSFTTLTPGSGLASLGTGPSASTTVGSDCYAYGLLRDRTVGQTAGTVPTASATLSASRNWIAFTVAVPPRVVVDDGSPILLGVQTQQEPNGGYSLREIAGLQPGDVAIDITRSSAGGSINAIPFAHAVHWGLEVFSRRIRAADISSVTETTEVVRTYTRSGTGTRPAGGITLYYRNVDPDHPLDIVPVSGISAGASEDVVNGSATVVTDEAVGVALLDIADREAMYPTTPGVVFGGARTVSASEAGPLAVAVALVPDLSANAAVPNVTFNKHLTTTNARAGLKFALRKGTPYTNAIETLSAAPSSTGPYLNCFVNGVASTSLTPGGTLPGSTGDLLVAFIVCRHTVGAGTVGLPAGWTLAGTFTHSGYEQAWIAYRFRQEGDTIPTFTVPANYGGAHIDVLRNVDTTNPVVTTAELDIVTGGVGVPVNGPAHSTPPVPGCVVAQITIANLANASGASFTGLGTQSRLGGNVGYNTTGNYVWATAFTRLGNGTHLIVPTAVYQTTSGQAGVIGTVTFRPPA